jgi:hypothetical protein
MEKFEMDAETTERRQASLFEGLERDRGFSGAVLVSQDRHVLAVHRLIDQSNTSRERSHRCH